MRNKRVRAKHNKVAGRGSKSIDFISQMPNDVLQYILGLMPLKDAVNTGMLSTGWRHLWCDLLDLDFDADEVLDKIARDYSLRCLEGPKYIKQYINQVNSVMRHHKGPMVRSLRIHFDLDCTHKRTINRWVKFAIYKKVQKLELNLTEMGYRLRRPQSTYCFPVKVLDISLGHTFKWMPLNAMNVKTTFLKELILKSVGVGDVELDTILKTCSVLETLSIYGSIYLMNVTVGGKSLGLKRFEIMRCPGVQSVYLYSFDLESFTYRGGAMNLDLVDLQKLEKLDIGQGNSGLENNVLDHIAARVSHLRVLSLDIHSPKRDLDLEFIPKLPNVKTLTLKMGASDDDSLLEYTKLVQACPNLETLAIELLWLEPKKKRKKVRHVPNYPHRHLKTLEFVGYYGRISDLELLVYVIDNASSLNKIFINPCCTSLKNTRFADIILEKETAARATAKRHLEPITPDGVELVIM